MAKAARKCVCRNCRYRGELRENFTLFIISQLHVGQRCRQSYWRRAYGRAIAARRRTLEGGGAAALAPHPNQGVPYVRYSDVIARNTARYDARLLGHIGSPESTMARGRASSRVARPLSAVAPGLRWLHGDAQLHASLHCPCDRLQKGACKRAAAVPLQFSAACTRALVAADVSELLIELQAIES